MNFVALPSEGRMSVDNEVIEIDLLPWLGPETEILVWNGDEGRGKIEYNDRKRLFRKIGLRDYFNEPVLADYLPMLNAWTTQASADMTLDQVKRLRCDIVDALYENKRIQPLQYGGYWYDARDEAVDFMNAQIVGSESTGLVASINTAFASVAYNENVYIVNHYNGHGADSSRAFRDFINGRLGELLSWRWDGANEGPFYFVGPGVSSTASYFGFAHMSHLPVVTVGAVTATGNVSWLPLNATAQVSIPYANFSGALTDIANRRTSLDGIRVNKRSSINAAITIAGVMAVNLASGW